MPQSRRSPVNGPRCRSHLIVQCLGLVSVTIVVLVNIITVNPDNLIGNDSFNMRRKLDASTGDYYYLMKKAVTGSTNSSKHSSTYSINGGGISLLRDDVNSNSKFGGGNSGDGGDDDVVPAIVTFIDTRKADSTGIVVDPVQQRDKKATTTATTSKYAGLGMSLQEWRTAYLHACRSDKVSGDDIQDMSNNFFQPFSLKQERLPTSKTPPLPLPPPPPPTTMTTATLTASKGTTIVSPVNNDINKVVEKCRYTFLDLGANVGDSLGKFIDSGWDPCYHKTDDTTTDNNKYQWYPKYNITTGIMDQFHKGDNVLVRFSRHFTRKGGLKPNQSPRYPESYCFYGLEGNPFFTPRLQALEERIMMMTPAGTTTTTSHSHRPRPVARVHFFTETIAAGINGPSILYLDTISKENNFWGSSPLTTARYVQESAERDNDGKPIEAHVRGMTLTSLIKQTTTKEEGSHLLVKVDIEGGEWSVFQEVWESGILCDYTSHGVIVNMLVEKHSPQFAAAGLDVHLLDKFMEDLTKCGVVIQGGGAAG